jgi:hypothetical protein
MKTIIEKAISQDKMKNSGKMKMGNIEVFLLTQEVIYIQLNQQKSLMENIDSMNLVLLQ